MDWVFGIGICTLRYMERLANGDLPYSTEKFTQYSAIIYVGKESERTDMYMHGWVIFVVQQKLSQPCKLTTLKTFFKKREFLKKWKLRNLRKLQVPNFSRSTG